MIVTDAEEQIKVDKKRKNHARYEIYRSIMGNDSLIYNGMRNNFNRQFLVNGYRYLPHPIDELDNDEYNFEDFEELDYEREKKSINDKMDLKQINKLGISVEISALQNIPFSEWSALRDFYEATNGINWSWKGTGNVWDFSSQLVNNPCRDNWSGIICTCNHYERPQYYYGIYYYTYNPTVDNSSCFVEKLVLNNYNVDGTIPSSIGNLTKLTTLPMKCPP
jgi:hypothetical protein